MRECTRTPEAEQRAYNTANANPCASFFRAVFSPNLRNAKMIAARFGVPSSTLVSRFYRAGLPSPKQYLAYARLVCAAHLGECPALSINAIAHRLNASSPQSFGRAVRLLMGRNAGEFRRAFDGPRMLQHFRAKLVTPYREKLRAFDPFGASVLRRASTARATTIPSKGTRPGAHAAANRRAA